MTIKECAALLAAEDNVLIITHTRPDGDTLCSAAALCSALRRAGKKAYVLSNPETTENYIDFISEYVTENSKGNEYVISVDLASEGLFPLNFSGKVMLSVDHHPSNSLYAENTVVDGTMAACGEIIMELIRELCGSITLREAELLYVAIATDCGCFCFGNTNARTLRDAAELLDLGVANGPLNKRFFRSLSRARLTLEGMIYTGLKAYRDGKINVAVITREMMERAGATEADCDDLASLAGKVAGNVVAITVRELEGGKSRASVRTNREVNASLICQRLGGGGHAMAAGCTAEMGPYELADRLVEITNEIWK